MASNPTVKDLPSPFPVRVPLWDNAGDVPFLEIFPALLSPAAIDATVILFPGGGYAGLSPYDGAPLAEFFRALGLGTAVVHYRVAPARFPDPYHDATRAIRLVRCHGGAWRLPARRIILMGLSAGGHLAALAATAPDLSIHPDDDLKDAVPANSDGLILGYPVIRTASGFGHSSIDRLLGPDAPEEERRKISPELLVTPSTPPAFLFHAADDDVVNAANSIAFAQACWSSGVRAHLHLFPRGGHGYRFFQDPAIGLPIRDLLRHWIASEFPDR